jgi:glycosyltransferase involved in cell wall biosynthesis
MYATSLRTTMPDSLEGSRTAARDARPLVSAVIPCLNEERTIGFCIDKAFRSFREMGVEGEVVVADNGSSDRSVEISAAHGARVVHATVKGYGAALRAGIDEAAGEIIVIGDGDESYDWSAIAPFVNKVREGYDLVMGNRFLGPAMPGAMRPLHRYLGNPVLSAIARIAFRTRIGDFHCGMRAFTKLAYERMLTKTTGMEFATEMVANACHQGLRITEIPTTLYPDKRDRAPHLRSFRDGWRHLRFILTYAPDHLFLLPGLLMLAAGVGLQLALVAGPLQLGGLYLGIHFVALGALLALVGFNVFNLGVFAKALLSRRYEGLRSRTVRWLRSRYSLELGLGVGAVLIVAGLAIDAGILVRWLGQRGGAMESTIHLAFVATTAVVLGVNVLFSAFLLNLVLDQDSD